MTTPRNSRASRDFSTPHSPAVTEVAQTLDDVRAGYLDETRREIQSWPEELSLEEADAIIDDSLGRARLHQDAQLIELFKIGEAARRVKMKAEWGTFQEKLEHIANRHGQYPNKIRYVMGVAEKMQGATQKLEGFLRSEGVQKRWKDLKEIFYMDAEMVARYGGDALWEEVQRRLEHAGEGIAMVTDAQEKENLRGQTEHVIEEADRFRDTALEARENATEEAQGVEVGGSPKSTPERGTEQVRAFDRMLRSMACAFCGVEADVIHVHHVAPSAAGLKQSEYFKVPACPDCHHTLHAEGYAAIKSQTGTDVRAAVAKVLHYFVTGEWARFPPGLD